MNKPQTKEQRMNKIDEHIDEEIAKIKCLYREITQRAVFLNDKVKILTDMKPGRINYNPAIGVTGVKHSSNLVEKSCYALMESQAKLRAYKVMKWYVEEGE